MENIIQNVSNDSIYYNQDNIVIINSDCLKVNLPDNCVDMVLTSPPYDNLRTYNDIIWNEDIWKKIIKDLYRIVKIGGVVVWIVRDATINGDETGTSFKQALYAKECGFNLHDTMIYQKNALSYPTFDKYYSIFEYMFIFSKEKPKTINLIQDRKNKQANKKITGNERQISGNLTQMSGAKNNRYIKEYGVRWNIWQYNTGWQHSYNEEFLKGHPAIFPIALAKDHIISWSNEKDIILDPLMGSGTTLLAANQLNRKAVGVEISLSYCDIAKKRIENYKNKENNNE